MKKLLCLLLALMCLCPAALAEVHVEEDPPEDWAGRDLMRLTVFRTGEGDCMLLEAGGECMMIDGGPYKYREKLRDALNAREIHHFKYIFSTHPHDDHIDGLRMLMSYGFTADAFVSVFPRTVTYDLYQKCLRQMDRSGIPFRQVEHGEVLSLGGAEITILCWPQGYTINAQSAAARITFGTCSALLCADIVGDTQQHFLKTLAPEMLKADVIKAAHHGLTPMVKAFLDAVAPDYMVVTNYHNDRVKKTEDQARFRNLPIQFSGSGTVILECDGTDWYIHQTLGQF